MRALAAPVLVALVLSGCAMPWERGDPVDPTAVPTGGPPPPVGPPLRFGGTLRDAVTGELLANASVRIDLSQALPCGNQGIGWTSWHPETANGTWGPLEVPRPRSDDVAFFIHASAQGYSPNATFIGPTQARGDISAIAIALHPLAAVEGSAPPGTVVALDAPSFPRVAVAAANGTFSFPNARVANASFVAATDVPYRAIVLPPAQLDVPEANGRGWLLEGIVKAQSGAPLAADVVAWNGSALVSAARAGENGVFSLPLAPEPATLRVEARTADDHYGGSRVLEIAGPPALRETILASALC